MNCLLRGMKGLEAHIIMRGDAQFAFKEGIEFPMQLDKLKKHGVIKKTKKSCWANSTVVTSS